MKKLTFVGIYNAAYPSAVVISPALLEKFCRSFALISA